MATLIPTVFSLFKDNYYHKFDNEEFEKETSIDFDTQEIAQATARYEQQAKQMVQNKEEVKKVIQLIDLTALGGDDTAGRLTALTDRGLNPIANDSTVTVAAICMWPQRVADVQKHLKKIGKKIPIACVAAGFPSGQYHLRSKVLEVEICAAENVDEIDIVISRAAALEEDWKTIYDEVWELKKASGNAHMKTILATGELKTLSNVYKASWASILAGSDFIKTSTGKESVNATLEAGYIVCQAIKRWYEKTGRKVGFKPAGGIKEPEEALAYVAMVREILGEEWANKNLLRIGASSLLDSCLKAL